MSISSEKYEAFIDALKKHINSREMPVDSFVIGSESPSGDDLYCDYVQATDVALFINSIEMMISNLESA